MAVLWISFGILVFVSNGYAFWRGGWSGKVISTVLMLAAAATPFFILLLRSYGLPKLHAVFAVDMALLLALGFAAFRTDRYWPLWLTALHLIAVCAELVAIIEGVKFSHQHEAMQAFWAVPMQLILAGGVLLDRRAMQRQRHEQAAPDS